MAGTNADFNATEFRTNIRNVMLMGTPTQTSEQATFQWTAEKSFSASDLGGDPWDFAATPTSTVTHADVQVPVAVEFTARPGASADEVAGHFDASRAVITILDEDYALVQGADLVVLGGNTYEVEFVAPPVGLFDVTVYTVYAIARDES